MLHLLLVWVLSALGLYLTASIVPGFVIGSFGAAMLAAVVVGFFNMLLRPLLLLLTLPINILTLGLFTFVVNAVILKIGAALISGFEIKSWWTAILGAVVLAIIQSILFWLFEAKAA